MCSADEHVRIECEVRSSVVVNKKAMSDQAVFRSECECEGRLSQFIDHVCLFRICIAGRERGEEGHLVWATPPRLPLFLLGRLLCLCFAA